MRFCLLHHVLCNADFSTRHCGVKDPSWAEIRHFVRFLDIQLQSCEKSCFTNPEFAGDVLTGFKDFVIKFMIQMSRVSFQLPTPLKTTMDTV